MISPMNDEELQTNKKSPEALNVEVGRVKEDKTTRTTDITIAGDKEFVHQLHVLVCKVLGLDDEDHEDDELAEPLESAIMRLVSKRDSIGGGELSELYSNKNTSLAVRDIVRSVNSEFEPGADDYDEALKSRFMLMARRMRDRYESHTQQIALEARIDEVNKALATHDITTKAWLVTRKRQFKEKQL